MRVLIFISVALFVMAAFVQAGSYSARVVATSDNAYYEQDLTNGTDNNFFLGGSSGFELDLGRGTFGGIVYSEVALFRFLNPGFKSGDVIDSCNLITTSRFLGVGNACKFRIKAELAASPATFSTYADYAARTWTSTYHDTTVTSIKAANTIDTLKYFAPVMQYLADNTTRAGGEPVVIGVFDNNTVSNNYRGAYAFDAANTTRAALFEVWWHTPIPPISVDTAGGPVAFPLQVSSNGHYLTDFLGAPFLWAADAAWSLPTQITSDSIAMYFADRTAKGFNVAMVNFIEHRFCEGHPANVHHDLPFTGQPFTTPNENYWTFIDTVVVYAKEAGVCLEAHPLYLGSGCNSNANTGPDGFCTDVKNATYDDMKIYGQFLGTRYRHHRNIVWSMGGDADPRNSTGTDGTTKNKLDTLAKYIKQYDRPGRLFTAHGNVTDASNTETQFGTNYVDLRMIYTYTIASNPTLMLTASNLQPAKPVMQQEGWYENANWSQGSDTWSPQTGRAQLYWAMLSGGCGYTPGNNPLWYFQMDSNFTAEVPPLPYGWFAAMNSSFYQQVAYCNGLFEAHAWWLLQPDRTASIITSGAGSGTTLAVFASASDGTLIMGYAPTQRAMTINPSAISATRINPKWFNPQTGVFTDLGVMNKTATVFTPPASGDWVLIIEGYDEGTQPGGTKTYFGYQPPHSNSSRQIAPSNKAAIRCQIPADGTIDSIYVWANYSISGTGPTYYDTLGFGVYSDNAGAPSALLGKSNIKVELDQPGVWIGADMVGTSVTAGQYVWLTVFYMSDNDGESGAGRLGRATASPQVTWQYKSDRWDDADATWGSLSSFSEYPLEIYGVLNANGTPGPTGSAVSPKVKRGRILIGVVPCNQDSLSLATWSLPRFSLSSSPFVQP